LGEDEQAAIADAQAALEAFEPLFERAYHSGLLQKAGIVDPHAEDIALMTDILRAMTANKVDFTLFFRRLSDAAASPEADGSVCSLFAKPAECATWLARWRWRLSAENRDGDSRRTAMRRVNPAFIPRNHRVEAVIRAAADGNDFHPFEELLKVLSHPYADQPGFEKYARPPEPHEEVQQTFCGT
jgi:uncharacterized protein YdiU (UPF0061 family)